jgi:PAS domain S-box-containing protein
MTGDITERKQAEDRYRSLFESTIDAVFIGDSGGNYVDVNPAAAEMLGVPREQLIGQHYSNFIPPEMIEEAKKLRLQVRQQGHYRGEFPMRRTDGSTVRAEYRTRFNGQYVIGVARDVTERKRMEEALRQSEERLRLALDGARIGMWSVDVATNELECTPLNLEIFGLPLNGPAPKIQVWIDLVHPDDRAKVLDDWEGGAARNCRSRRRDQPPNHRGASSPIVDFTC